MQAGDLSASGSWRVATRRGAKVVFVGPSAIHADSAVTPSGSCFTPDAAQVWSVIAPHLANSYEAFGFPLQARSLHHNAGCPCSRLWCGSVACTENVEATWPRDDCTVVSQSQPVGIVHSRAVIQLSINITRPLAEILQSEASKSRGGL